MVNKMTIQNYLIVENNIVTNHVLWDGNAQTWQPPVGAIMLVKSTTPALRWFLNSEKTDYVLAEVIGGGDIGFTWNGLALSTNLPKPSISVQPSVTGVQHA